MSDVDDLIGAVSDDDSTPFGSDSDDDNFNQDKVPLQEQEILKPDNQKFSDRDIFDELNIEDSDEENIEYSKSNRATDDLKNIANVEKSNEDEPEQQGLEKILGKNIKKDGEKWKEKTQSKLSLPQNYKLEDRSTAVFARLPKFISLQQKEFNPNSYDASEEKSEFESSTAIMRWKERASETDSAAISNTRLLKWSDGTYQLVVGDSVFHVKMAPSENCFVYEMLNGVKETSDDVHSTNCLECSGTVSNRAIIEPLSLDSDTHTRMSLNILQKHKKEKKINIADYELLKTRPDIRLREVAKEEDERMRKELKNKQRNAESSKRFSFLGSRKPAMTSDYFEGDDYLSEEEEEETEKRPSFREDTALPKKSKKPTPKRKDDRRDTGEILGSEDSYSEDSDPGEEDRNFIASDDDDGVEDYEDDSEPEADDMGDESDEDIQSVGSDADSKDGGERNRKEKSDKKKKKKKGKVSALNKGKKYEDGKVKKASVDIEQRKRQADIVEQSQISESVAGLEDDDAALVQQPVRKKLRKAFNSDDEDD